MSYTVIAREKYNYEYSCMYCLGVFSTKDRALDSIILHKTEYNAYQYNLFLCEVDISVIIDEDDDVFAKDAKFDKKNMIADASDLLKMNDKKIKKK